MSKPSRKTEEFIAKLIREFKKKNPQWKAIKRKQMHRGNRDTRESLPDLPVNNCGCDRKYPYM